MEPEFEEKTERDRTSVGRSLGKYRLLASIGRGGMGEVYLAMSHGFAGFKKLVVLKCMHAESADDENLRTMFLDEAMLAARLSHHNVVQTYEAGELDGLPYIAMEYLEGQPLSRLTRAVPVMEPRMAAHIISEVLAGLHYAHQLKDFDGTPLSIVHRDLSPPNIFVTYDGVVKVVDFGIAKTSLASRVKSDTGTFKGKIAYMAPEQAMLEEVDHRADIFSVGAVLWELVAGKRLFREVSPALTLKRLLRDDIPVLSSERPETDPALDAIVARALQRNPADRYPDALAMRKDLEQFLQSGASANLDAELAVLMGDKFSRHRRKVQQQVQLCMARDGDSHTSLPNVNLTDGGAGTSGTRLVPLSMDMTQTAAVTISDSASGIAMGSGSQSVPSNLRLDSSPVLGSQSSHAAPRSHASQSPPSLAPPPSRLHKLGTLAAVGALIVSAAGVAWMMLSTPQSAAYEVARQQTAAPATASLEVVSTPPGAMIFVNGEPSGLVTPAVLKGLQIGRSVTLRLDKAGFQATEQQVDVAGGKTVTRTFQLVEADGKVRFAGAPSGARVYVDDVAVAEGTHQAVRVPVGTRNVRVESDGHLLFSRSVSIVAGEQTIDIESGRHAR